MKKYFLFVLIISYFFISCAPFQDSIFSDKLLRKERNLNSQNTDEIKDIENDGKIRIAVMADSHQNYKPLDQTIIEINATPEVDFVANLGDFSNSGYNLEFDQFLKSYSHIRYPRLTVIGNHDAIGAGPSLFRKSFGETNFWFESNTHRFVFFNSANLEDPENFKPEWLLETVNASTKPVVIFTHIALEDSERFSNPTLSPLFNQVIQKAQLILNGHNHVYFSRNLLSTPLIQGPRVEIGWMLLDITGNQLKVTQMPQGIVETVTLK